MGPQAPALHRSQIRSHIKHLVLNPNLDIRLRLNSEPGVALMSHFESGVPSGSQLHRPFGPGFSLFRVWALTVGRRDGEGESQAPQPDPLLSRITRG